MIIEKSIKRTILLASTIIIFIVTTIIGAVLIKTEYRNFKTHIKNFRDTLIEREKFYIKTAVENLKNDIEFEKISILNNKKKRIKNQSIIAYNLAKSLYEKTKNLSKEQQIYLIKSSLSQISNEKSDIHYFILDKQGNILLNSENRKDEGLNFLNFEDINGVKFINKILGAPKNRQNYIEYYWYKPNKRVTFSRHLQELDIVIGSASFLESQNEELTDKLMKKVILQEFNEEEFLLIYRIDSLNSITKEGVFLTQRNIIAEIKEKEAIEELMINSNYKGGEYIVYDGGKKILYGIFHQKLRYFISVGSNLFKIDSIVEKEKEISLNNMYSKITKLAVIMFIMILIFFIFSFIFSKKIEQLFNRYRKRVKENEEKYALLFNHSNDGFIISQINKNRASILSMNNTALNITKYDSKQLLDKEFFSLFLDLNLETLLEKRTLFKTVKLKNRFDEIKTIELNAIIYEYENKSLIFASLRDITERIFLKEEKLKQENILIQKSKMAAMGEMIGNIAHQWRQPLAQISGLFFDIESAYDYKELDKSYLSKRVDEANDLLEYMSRTIDDFRNFFNPNSIKEEFFIKEAVINAKNIVSSTLKYHSIKIIIDIDKDLKLVGYKNEYSQAIVNIVSNAKDILIEREIKEPVIRIYMKDENELCIQDNGGGVNNKIIDRIFDPYFTTKRDYGTGIGLYMTKLIIEEKMNGSIYVKNVEHGAQFYIRV